MEVCYRSSCFVQSGYIGNWGVLYAVVRAHAKKRIKHKSKEQ